MYIGRNYACVTCTSTNNYCWDDMYTHYINYDNIIVDPMIVVLANITAYIILRKYKQNKNFKGGMSRSAHAHRDLL